MGITCSGSDMASAAQLTAAVRLAAGTSVRPVVTACLAAAAAAGLLAAAVESVAPLAAATIQVIAAIRLAATAGLAQLPALQVKQGHSRGT